MREFDIQFLTARLTSGGENVPLDAGQTFQPAQVSVPAPSPGFSPVIAFCLGVAAALLLGGLILALRRLMGAGACRTPGGVETAHLHEIGARDSQQDAFCIAGDDAPNLGLLAAVADGMGGLVNSGQVSLALIDTLAAAYAPGGDTPPARQLQLLFQQALRQVEDCLADSTAHSGSTLAACLIRDGGLSWLSVGDSRIYLWRGGGLIQLNRDHDFHHDLTMLALQGEMDWSAADSDPRRENLTSYIGRGFPRKVEWNPEPVPLMAGDRVLLVSDGVYRSLSPEELARCLSSRPRRAARLLRAEIERKALPQQDNYTAVILGLK